MAFDRFRRLLRHSAALAGAAVLLACAAPPGPGGAGSPGAASPATPAPTTPAAQDPVAPALAADAPPSARAAPLSPQEVQRAVSSALDFLQDGQEDQAEVELNKILQSDPNNRLAHSLLRQIKDDPVGVLGNESFAYRVQPGESLSRIAQRFMSDLYQFYILARYNNIKVPRNLAGGQMIRVPGKAPPAGAAAAPSSATAPAPPLAATPAPAPASAPAATAASTGAAAAALVARQRSEAIARHSRAARAAFAKQDLDAAIRAWDAVLEIDPDNRMAQLEKQRVQGLKEKLGKVK